jgi:hypothetical protein
LIPGQADVRETEVLDAAALTETSPTPSFNDGFMPHTNAIPTLIAVTQNRPNASDLTDLELFTRREVAAVLKIKESWLRDNQTRLALPHTCVGRQVRYSRDDIAAIASMGRSTAIAAPSTTTPASAIRLTPLPKGRRPSR